MKKKSRKKVGAEVWDLCEVVGMHSILGSVHIVARSSHGHGKTVDGNLVNMENIKVKVESKYVPKPRRQWPEEIPEVWRPIVKDACGGGPRKVEPWVLLAAYDRIKSLLG